MFGWIGPQYLNFGRKEYQKDRKARFTIESGDAREVSDKLLLLRLKLSAWFSIPFQITTRDCVWMLPILGYDCRSDLIGTLYIQWVLSNGFGKMNASSSSSSFSLSFLLLSCFVCRFVYGRCLHSILLKRFFFRRN